MRRKSAAELTVIPVLPGRGRPEPPEDLDRLERNVWNQVVDALPGHWLDPAGQIVLRRTVAQAANCERHGARLRALRAQDQDAGEDAQALAAAHAALRKS